MQKQIGAKLRKQVFHTAYKGTYEFYCNHFRTMILLKALKLTVSLLVSDRQLHVKGLLGQTSKSVSLFQKGSFIHL